MNRRQNDGSVKAVSPRHCAATSALRNCCFNCRAGQSHKDNVRCTAVDEQLEAKEVQLSQLSSTSLLMVSSRVTWRSSSTSYSKISWSFDLAWNLDIDFTTPSVCTYSGLLVHRLLWFFFRPIRHRDVTLSSLPTSLLTLQFSLAELLLTTGNLCGHWPPSALADNTTTLSILVCNSNGELCEHWIGLSWLKSRDFPCLS